MKTVLGLVLLLAASSHGLDSICDATQDAACYGALGGRVYLQLMRNTKGHTLMFHNESEMIFRFRNSKTTFYGNFNTTSFLQRCQFVPDNGTLIINPVEKRESGTYRVEIHNSSGKLVGDQTVQLVIEAPVSDVDLSISCLANGTRSVRCSSNGDSLQYSWSLDGRPLSDTDADLSTDNQTLSLRGCVIGTLSCSVRNHVSSTHTSALLQDVCSGLDSICDATQDAACYGALGGRVYLQLMRNTKGHTLMFHNESEMIFRFRNSKTTFYGNFNTTSFLQRWQFVPDNGTLIINPVEKRDSGTYRVEIHNSSGKMVGNQTVQLVIEAPVFDVHLSISCLANGTRSVRCSSNGDSLQYSWSLDGRPLSDTDADLSTDNQTLSLWGCVIGTLSCSVRNHVSSTHTSALLQDVCSAAACFPVFISVWLAEIIILTSLLVGGYCLRNKRSHTPDGRKDQEVELTPTSMSHRRRRRTPEEVQVQ